MSSASIHQLIGLATVDRQFCQQLLTDPLSAIRAQGFDLTPTEQEVLGSITTRDLTEFSRLVLDRLNLEEPEDR